jgi:hypothetical protein
MRRPPPKFIGEEIYASLLAGREDRGQVFDTHADEV